MIQKNQFFSQKISIAPMLDWTDRHYRYFLRFITHHATLYTEMVACPALILGRDKELLLDYNPEEHPLILQVGGSEPKLMAQCAKMAESWGYEGININAGCPSQRVQSGKFGAILMKTPEVIADCVAEMSGASRLPVSVKTRISLSDVGGDGWKELFHLADLVKKAGCSHLIVHARQAKLNWRPKENRLRLPLNYDLVYKLKKSFPDMPISINGNVLSLTEAQEHLKHVDGVMIGRWAYGHPYELRDVDKMFYNDNHPILSREEVLEKMIPYMQKNYKRITRIIPHMMGLYRGEPNTSLYKKALISRDLDNLKAFLKDSQSP